MVAAADETIHLAIDGPAHECLGTLKIVGARSADLATPREAISITHGGIARLRNPHKMLRVRNISRSRGVSSA
jgi:hypothetical protein